MHGNRVIRQPLGEARVLDRSPSSGSQYEEMSGYEVPLPFRGAQQSALLFGCSTESVTSEGGAAGGVPRAPTATSEASGVWVPPPFDL